MSDNNVKKLIKGLVASVQDVEDMLSQLYLLRGVDTATFEQLDVIGRIVGEKRNGLEDDVYRRVLRARISANRSKGRIKDLINVADLVVYDDDAHFVVDNQGIAAVVLRLEDVVTDWEVAEITIRLLRDAVAAGVRIILEFWLSPEEDLFAFDTFDPGNSTRKGFGSTLDASVGGKLASALE